MNFQSLLDFVERQMTMSHINQPLLLRMSGLRH